MRRGRPDAGVKKSFKADLGSSFAVQGCYSDARAIVNPDRVMR